MSEALDKPGFVTAKLSRPNDAPNRQRLLARMRTPPRPAVAPPAAAPYETRAQELKRKQDAASAIAQAQRGAQVDRSLEHLPDPACIATIRGILAEHEQAKSREAAVFSDYDFIEDLDRAKPEKRQADFAAIIDVLETVTDRCIRLDSALGDARRLALTPEQQASVDAASRLKGMLTEHVPDQFWKERFTLPARRELITAAPDRKREILAQEKAGFPEGQDFAARFQEVIEPHSTRSFERTSFYFDRFVSAPSAAELAELADMTGKIVAKAYRIRDAGGALADVEEMMASTKLPEEWWPPNFIRSLQAWRKCEREFLRRDAVKLCEKNIYDLSSPADIVKFIQDQAHEAAGSAKQMFAEILKNGDAKKAIGEFADQLKTNFGMGEEVAGALEANEFEGLQPNVARQLFDGIVDAETKLSTALNAAASVAKKTGSAPGDAAKVGKLLGDHAPAITGALADHAGDIAEVSGLIASFVPGLALGVAGLKLGLALAELAKQGAMLGVARAAEDESVSRVARGELEDGFALTYALQNEQQARGIAMGKAGVKVSVATLDVAGAGAELGGAHFGVAAKYTLKVTGKVITYGSQIVFTNIEWARADDAKQLIAEARAGNPVARIELFKQAAQYAKLYIAILAREDEKTARSFVESNGIDETTIANKANAIWILEAALRADSGQKAEDEIADKWQDANTRGAYSKIAAMPGAVVSAAASVKNKVQDLRRGDERKQDYDRDWRYNGSADISASTWRSAKDEAYGAGLHDDHGTGISDAVAKAETRRAEAASLLGGAQAAADPAVSRTTVLKAIASLNDLAAALCEWSPMSNGDENDRQEVHAGMTEFMVRLRVTARQEADKLNQELVKLGLKDTNFQAAIGAEPLDDQVWATNWAAAVEKACLPARDGGVEKALARAMKHLAARDATDRNADPQGWRRACLALKDALDEVLVVAEGCRGIVAEIPSMTGALQRIISSAAQRLRELDAQLAGGWPKMPAKPEKVSGAEWKSFYAAACAGGAAAQGTGDDITSALARLETLEETIEKRESDPQKQLAAEMAFRDATGKLMLATAEFLRGQRDAAEPLKLYVLAIGEHARSEQVAKADRQTDRPFAPRPNLTVEAWQETYDNAVEAGAILANKDIRSGVSERFARYVAAQAELEKLRGGTDFRKIRAGAIEVQTALTHLAAEISKAMADRGFSGNKLMSQYLGQRLDRIRKLMKDLALSNAADGAAAPAASFRPQSPTWDIKGWDRIKKDAIAQGVIPDAPTGLTPQVTAAAEAFATVRALEPKARTPEETEELRKARVKAVARVTALKQFATGPFKQLSRHPGWAAYADAWAKLCDNTLNGAELQAA